MTMDAARWKEVEALFHRARALPSTEAIKVLNNLRSRDPTLVEQVEAMLRAHQQSSVQLGGIVQTAMLGALEQLPETIGPYEVVSRIGTGGFCSVYLAQLHSDPAQRVAVKVLRRGLALPDSTQRLLQETEILARLHHPNIARLLGHGTSRLGEPYFAMEFVEGEPIDQFCDTRRLTVDARLRLFRLACAAVDYAHRNLVIHRDIKPSNLLVTHDGVPKLLDFGIAKLMLPELLRVESVHTVAGGSLMTPDFASPEQVREEPLTTATDVYSLGVLLYRLLCGRPPYRFADRSPRTIDEVISTVEPPAPSTRLVGGSRQRNIERDKGEESTSEDIARLRRSTVPQLRSKLYGDLDSIVLMALSKEPEQRYSSVQQLSRDLSNYLHSMPVAARRITTGYRIRKFVRRHRLAVGVVAAIVLTLMTAVVVTTRATLRAEAQQARAERHLAESRQVTEFLVDIFEVPDPETAQGREISAKELLDEGARRIAAQLEHQPEIRASLMVTMGRVYRNLGDHQKSKELLAEALDFHRQQSKDSDPAVIDSLQQLARSLLVQGEFETAQKLLGQARSSLEASGQTSVVVYAQTLSLLAEASQQRSKLAEAEALYRQALEIQRRLLAPDDPELIDTLSGLAELSVLRRNFDHAEAMFRTTLELRRSRLGNKHPDIAANLSNLTVALHGQGRLEEAESAIREAVGIRSELYGEQHWIVGKSYNNLGQILAAQGRTEEALPWMEKALEVGRSRLGPDHPQIGSRSVNLARLYQRVGRLDEAEELFLKALEVHRKSLGDEHPSTARNLNQLADLYATQGRETEALELLDHAIDILRKVLPPNDYLLSYPLLLRGRIYANQGDCSQALPDLEQALRLRQQRHPEGHPNIAVALAEKERCSGPTV